jgi:mRNA-degrading endonuclease toxin of MazEF toxin-antitoxin module
MSLARPPRRGEIWSAYLPGQPYDPHQPRPTLIISNNARNLRSDDVIVIPLFSRGHLGTTHIFVRAGLGGLRHDSVLFCEEITTIHHDFLVAGPCGGLVPERLLYRVLIALRHAVT